MAAWFTISDTITTGALAFSTVTSYEIAATCRSVNDTSRVDVICTCLPDGRLPEHSRS